METFTDTMPASLVRKAFLPATLLLAMLAAFMVAQVKDNLPTSARSNEIDTKIEAARDAANNSNHPTAIKIARDVLASATGGNLDGKYAKTAAAILRASLLATTTPMVLKAHDGPVTSLLFLNDGARLVTASGAIAGADTSIKIWNLNTKKILRTLNGHLDTVTALRASPDGNILASSSRDHTVRLWNLKKRSREIVLRGHRDTIRDVKFTPDGDTIITASADHTARIWDPRTGRLRYVLRGHLARLTDLAVTSDGKTVVTASRDATAGAWSIETGKQVAAFEGHTAGIWSVKISPDDKLLVTAASDASMRVWNMNDARQLNTFKADSEIYTLALAAKTPIAAVGSRSGQIGVVDLLAQKPLATLQGHELAVYDLQITPDQRHILSASWDGSVRTWDIESQTQIAKLKTGSMGYWSIAIGEKANAIAAGDSSGNLYIWPAFISRAELIAAANKFITAQDLGLRQRKR